MPRMAAHGSLSHRIRLEGHQDEFRELADSFDAMLRGSKRRSPNSADSPPTLPTSCALHWLSRRVFSTSPATTRTATAASSSIAFGLSTLSD